MPTSLSYRWPRNDTFASAAEVVISSKRLINIEPLLLLAGLLPVDAGACPHHLPSKFELSRSGKGSERPVLLKPSCKLACAGPVTQTPFLDRKTDSPGFGV